MPRPRPLPVPTDSQVERQLAAMSLEEKAGQLFMAWILSYEKGQAANRERLLGYVREGLVGGVVLSTGTMPEARRLIAELRRAAQRPLLIAGDFETGLTLRLEDAPHLGNAMLLGATGSPELAYRVGKATGESGAELGFDIAFAPVLDVNNNPDNPIINVRSLGEDPQKVSRLGVALIRGIQEHMLATAKHFPGHGDVNADSHLVLPTVAANRRRLDEVELPPFRAAVDAGVQAVMTAHLDVPALDPRRGLPATVSHRILTDLLRKDMGFRGIIVTDALEMGGMRRVMPGDRAAVDALRAGADLLLMPPDPRQARAAIVAAVRKGVVSRRRLDDAVRRLLSAKLELLRRPSRQLGHHALDAHRALGREVARRGITLVTDSLGLVPFEPGEKWCLLDLRDKRRTSGDDGFSTALRAAGVDVVTRPLDPQSNAADIGEGLAEARRADRLLVAMHVKVRAFSGKIGLPPQLRGVIDVLQKHPRAVAVSFGNPYLVRDFPDVKAYVCAYDQGPTIETAVARALAGKEPITGRLPISIPGVAKIGAGLSRFSGGGAADATRQGFPVDFDQRIAKLLDAQIARGAFPGAVAMVTRRGKVVAWVAAGRETYAADSPEIERVTRYDLASLTKVCATLPALAVLLDGGVVSLDHKLQKWVPAFLGANKDKVTIRHIMVHSSGLPAYIKFFYDKSGKGVIVEAAANTALEYIPGTKKIYSDLGLMLLMAVVEKASGKTLDRFLREDVYPKLDVEAVFSQTGRPIDAPATEVDDWRGRLVRGEVHDENAYAMGGVSGHAGLFGTARDVARIGNLFLGGGGGLISPVLARQLTRRDGTVPGSTRALLWDTFRKGGSGGSKLSPDAFGHTGFTGTSVWCDPQTDLCMVLLTNRVHPTRKNRKIAAARQAFHDLVMDCLDR